MVEVLDAMFEKKVCFPINSLDVKTTVECVTYESPMHVQFLYVPQKLFYLPQICLASH